MTTILISIISGILVLGLICAMVQLYHDRYDLGFRAGVNSEKTTCKHDWEFIEKIKHSRRGPEQYVIDHKRLKTSSGQYMGHKPVYAMSEVVITEGEKIIFKCRNCDEIKVIQ
jgi:hypothetical protein